MDQVELLVLQHFLEEKMKDNLVDSVEGQEVLVADLVDSVADLVDSVADLVVLVADQEVLVALEAPKGTTFALL